MARRPGTVNRSDPAIRRALWERDAGCCGFCGEPVSLAEMHVDHILPRAVGGQDELDNLRPAHARCNLGNGLASVRAYRREHPDEPVPTKGHAVLFLRVSRELHQALTMWASDEDRPLNQHVLRDHIAQHKAQPPPRPLAG